jgi:ribosomal protein S18 acetylase RimI-like enzyme
VKRGESGNNRRRGRRAPGQATRASDPTGKASQLDVLIAPVAPADVESVIALARLVWQQTYPGIITQEQIDFMLEQRYSRQRLLEELTMPQVWWDQASVDGQLAGFSSCMVTGGGEMKLDKLYVDPARQRSGIGARLIDQVVSHARTVGCPTLILAVNKRNERAIAAYGKQGFAIRESVCVDIGNGFLMDDFIMAKSLLAQAAPS